LCSFAFAYAIGDERLEFARQLGSRQIGRRGSGVTIVDFEGRCRHLSQFGIADDIASYDGGLRTSEVSADIIVNPKGRIRRFKWRAVGSYRETAPASTRRRDWGPPTPLSCGFSSQDDPSPTPFNFSASGFVLAPQQMGNANAWYAGAGQIIDPTSLDWSGFTLTWFLR
jgi:hypothetical protein